jgi:hypothetical protein
MTLTERLAKLVTRLDMEGRYVDAHIVYEGLAALCYHEGLAIPEVSTENSCGQEEKM